MIPELAPLEGKYEILRKLREGGMGAIYLVRHRLLDELRVVKVLRPQIRDDADFQQRFVREARIATQLRHRNIAQVFDFAVGDDGTAFMVLEFIEGRTLQDLIAEGAVTSLRLKLDIARQGLRALDFLHRKGYVHRDVSPDNLMLTRDEDGQPLVKLLDLGIVRALQQESGQLTGTSVFLGKWRYASPEQFQTSQVDARSDLYSFGVLLYELLTGRYPIAGNDMRSIVAGHLSRPPLSFAESDPGGELPPALRQLVLAALEKDPARRVASAQELADGLGRIAVEEPAETEAPIPEQTARILGGPGEFGASPTTTQRELDRSFSVVDRTPARASLPQPEVPAGASPRAGAGGSTVPPTLRFPAPAVDDETAAPGGSFGEGAAASRSRRSGRILGVSAAAAALAALAVATIVLWPRPPAPEARAAAVSASPGSEQATRAAAAPPAASAVTPTGTLILDARPWGRLTALRPLDGRSPLEPPPEPYTPLRLELPPGRYEARLEHPDFGSRSIEVEVRPAALERRAVEFDAELAEAFVGEK